MEGQQNNTTGMWDEPIVELKIGGIDGISFRRGQVFGKKKPLVKDEIVVSDIKREIDDVDEEIFLIFARVNGKGDPKLLKSWKGKNFYATFDVFSEE